MKDAELEAGPGSALVFLFSAVPTGLWGSESTCDGGGVQQKTRKRANYGRKDEFNT